MCQLALGIERSHGEEGVEGKCRKDKVHDPWCRSESPGEYQFFVANALSVVQK